MWSEENHTPACGTSLENRRPATFPSGRCIRMFQSSEQHRAAGYKGADMHAKDERSEAGLRPEQLAAAVIGAFIVYILIVGLEGTGRHFLELGVMRVVLFGALLSFARWSGALGRRLGMFAIGMNGLAAVGFVCGAIGAIVTDGWSYDVFGPGTPADPPWYAFVIGLSGLLFAVSTILVGIAGRSAGRLAAAALVAGVSFPLVFALGDTAGHVAWFVPWFVLSMGLIRARSQRAAAGARAAHTVAK